MSLCTQCVGPDIDTDPRTHIHKQSLWPPSWPGGIDLIGLWPPATSHLPGSMEHWPLAQHRGLESLSSLTQLSRGLPSNRILSEVSTLKSVTCPSDIPLDTVCCHEYGHEYSTLAFFLSDGVYRGYVPPAVLFHWFKEVPYALKCHSSM